MASRFEAQDPAAVLTSRRECDNCGATEGLLRCSHCHAAWFCSLACHRAYWPFHKPACRRNDFADAVEPTEPGFAAWMRRHGRLAVLQDDEVERLERSSRPGGWRGLGRADVLDAMWGRADPRPAAPSYGDAQLAALAAAAGEDEAAAAAASGGISSSSSEWDAIEVPQGLGLSSARLKWRQNLAYVEVFVALPRGTSGRQVCVSLSPTSLSVTLAGETLLAGELAARIKHEGSTWFADGGVLTLLLLKANRRGQYANGCTAADTFWFSLTTGGPRLAAQHPPTAYYSTPETVL